MITLENIDNLVIVVSGEMDRYDVNLGTVTIESGDRSFIMDIMNTTHTINDEGDMVIECFHLEMDPKELEDFGDSEFDLEPEDLLDSNCTFEVWFEGGDIEYEVKSIQLHVSVGDSKNILEGSEA